MEELSRKVWESDCRRAGIVVKTHILNISSSLFNINGRQTIETSAKGGWN